MNTKLGKVCRFYSGTGFPIAYQGKDSGELPFYKVSDIASNVSEGNIYLSHCNNYISRLEASELKGTILPKGTVVFAKIGEALKLNRRAITVCDCLVDNNAMGIASDQDVLREGYFFYFMKNLKMQDHAEATTVPSVRKSKLEQVAITVPSMAEQEVIEKRLDKVSEIINKRFQEIRVLDDLIKARFVELFEDPHSLEVYECSAKKGRDGYYVRIDYSATSKIGARNEHQGYFKIMSHDDKKESYVEMEFAGVMNGLSAQYEVYEEQYNSCSGEEVSVDPERVAAHENDKIYIVFD